MHIINLYRNDGQDILMFRECYALEKVHGSSANISYNPLTKQLSFFSGGEKHERFLKIFDQEKLLNLFLTGDFPLDKSSTVYGEVYGSGCQGMSETYGKDLKFVAFDVQVGECWLDVPKADAVVQYLGLEFVDYVKVTTDLVNLDRERYRPSVQAIRNGISSIGANGEVINPKKREGVVLRPLIELIKNNGSRIICKHKGDDFRETASPRPVVDPAKAIVLTEAQAIADEWVTYQRLEHILQKIPNHSMEKMRDIISAMVSDVNREGKDEFIPSETVNKTIGKKTDVLYKEYLKSLIGK